MHAHTDTQGTHMHTFTHTGTHIHAHAHMQAHTCMHTQAHTYMYMHTYLHPRVCDRRPEGRPRGGTRVAGSSGADEQRDRCRRNMIHVQDTLKEVSWVAWHYVQQINSDKINQCNLKVEIILSGEACCLKIVPTFLPVLTVPACM